MIFSFDVLVLVSPQLFGEEFKAKPWNLTDLFFWLFSVQSCLLCAALEVLALLTFVYVVLKRHQELET